VLDPHCHLTPAMLAGADCLVLMKEYPHTDYLERAAELHRICLDAAARRTTPVQAAFDCRMLGFYPTTGETMRGFVERMRELEARAGILSVSFAHGFPWGDTADTGSQVLVVADGDRALAAATAETLGREIYAAREALAPSFPNLDDALDLAERLPGRVVMADIADNAGGGAPGDNVSLLRAVRARALPHAVFGCVWDPVAAAACADAGVGARFPLRLGGKSGPTSGDPLDVEAVVRAISEAHDQTGLGSSRVRLGLSAWIEVDGVDVVVTSIRSQTFSPDAFTGLGVDLAGKRLIAVKSSQHFRTHFGAVADHVIQAATPGALQMDFAAIAYRKRRDFNVYPFVHAPLG
jgi:microcystin degradation protein MlrC